ncbi:hypothetical protein [Catalinimonas niigatensis]|uniref:hypothetical protein n=1 Tax=Catalinimonas niigatensis TaxID=1397264 RepID=UPI002666FB0A|nr:hypothetical protein [Catalinimonas niigatensis]WPP53553.1 hypothetical protein PZB72_14355 [Catalinimonas niigatensis]
MINLHLIILRKGVVEGLPKSNCLSSLLRQNTITGMLLMIADIIHLSTLPDRNFGVQLFLIVGNAYLEQRRR